MNWTARFTRAFVALVAVTQFACSSVNSGLAAFNRGNCSLAIQHWLPLANSGDPAAQNNMGLIWETGCTQWGEGIPIDHKEAYSWFLLAASNGHPTGIYNLGRYHEHGLGVDIDKTKAIAWYSLAARQAHQAARLRLAALGEEIPAPDLAPKTPAGHGSAWGDAFAIAFALGAAAQYPTPSYSGNATTQCQTRVIGDDIYTDCR